MKPAVKKVTGQKADRPEQPQQRNPAARSRHQRSGTPLETKRNVRKQKNFHYYTPLSTAREGYFVSGPFFSRKQRFGVCIGRLPDGAKQSRGHVQRGAQQLDVRSACEKRGFDGGGTLVEGRSLLKGLPRRCMVYFENGGEGAFLSNLFQGFQCRPDQGLILSLNQTNTLLSLLLCEKTGVLRGKKRQKLEKSLIAWHGNFEVYGKRPQIQKGSA